MERWEEECHIEEGVSCVEGKGRCEGRDPWLPFSPLSCCLLPPSHPTLSTSPPSTIVLLQYGCFVFLGPCPPCEDTFTQTCLCGRSSRTVACAEAHSERYQCEKMCKRFADTLGWGGGGEVGGFWGRGEGEHNVLCPPCPFCCSMSVFVLLSC